MNTRTIVFAVAACTAMLCAASSQTGFAAPSPKPAEAMVHALGYPDLQAAIDAIPSSGGILGLQPGRLEISKPLVITQENIRIVGAGAATHIVNMNENGRPAIVLRPSDREENGRSRIWRVQLANLRISGNPKSGDGLLAEGVNEIYLHGLSIDHNGGHGINLIDCYEDPRIADSIITYNGKAGLNLQACHDIVVNGNQFEENHDAVRCIDSFNLCMNGNNLDDHLRHGVVIENTYGSVVAGNMIEECNGTAIVIDRDCYGITVSANVIAHEGGGGVNLIDGWGCAVSANTFTIVKEFGVRVGPDSGRIAIGANNFSNAHIGGKTKRDDAATGVVLEHTSDIAVTGNVFTGMQTSAVQTVGKCQRVTITGNVMSDLSIAEPGKHPALDLGETNAVVEDNAIEKAK